MIARLPFVGFVFFYAAGILLADILQDYFLPDPFSFLPAIFAIVTFTVCCYAKRRHSLGSIGFSLFLFMSGLFSTSTQNANLAEEIRQVDAVPYDLYEAVVKALPEKRRKSVRVEAVVERVRNNKKWILVNAKALLSIPLDAETMPFPGDRVVVRGKLEKPGRPLNPEEFDYQEYLWNKGIAFTGYLPEGSYEVIKTDKSGFNPLLWSVYVSEWADKSFRTNITDDRSYGLVKAMLLGRRDDLRSDQVDDYTTSGTVHILSVSGMHVAMIFLVISVLCGWMKKLPAGRFIYLGTVTFLLVFYSIVTGFPPSVQRATVMCLVLVISEVFGKRHNSVNTLGISAFFILLLDPHALFDVGFQLSYLAMLGIFLFYQPLERIWMPSNRAFKMIWQVTALSFAAQLVTFPLSIYYFHQFPFYFWLVNPFVIGFTNILLPAAMLLLAVSLFPMSYVQLMVNWIVNMLAWLTNFSVAVPKALPGFLVENLYLDRVEMVMLFSLLFCIWYAYELRKFSWLRLVPVVVSVFAFYSACTSLESYLTSKAMIHAVPKHAVISFKDGDKLFVACDEAFVTDTNAYNFHLKNYAIKEGVTKRVFINQENAVLNGHLAARKAGNGTLLGWEGKTVFVGEWQHTSQKFDYFLISKSSFPTKEAPKFEKNTVVLLGGDLKSRSKLRWKSRIVASRLRFHDLDSSGALLLR